MQFFILLLIEDSISFSLFIISSNLFSIKERLLFLILFISLMIKSNLSLTLRDFFSNFNFNSLSLEVSLDELIIKRTESSS